MKRKTRRTGKKKLVAFFTPMGVIVAVVVYTVNVFKDSIIPALILHIKTGFELDEKSNLPSFMLFGFSITTIALLSFIISRLFLNYNKPNKKYFELIDFERPTDKVFKKAVEGILNSEKTQPYFVHAAPVNDEINLFYKKLYNDGFIWENGKPGEGKTMLAYHALYRYRRRIGFSYKYSIRLFWLKYRIYKLNLNHINDEKEIDLILDELDTLKGGKSKIVLIDDAHKLNFEDQLRFEFEEEAKEKSNGKFVWINTNYLEANKSDSTDSFNIDFENFYPKLIDGLYKSQNPILKEIIKNKCTGLQAAIKLKEQGRIKDPWHFNFVASNGEQRIIQLLEKLSRIKEEQDILLLSVFLFSARNIMTGEKEINQTEFTNILSNIEIPYFKNNIEKYQPNNIISDLGSQEKGRFIIIENKNSLDRGFLHAPHVKLSKAIIKSITIHITDVNLIYQMIDASKFLLTIDYGDSKYLSIYFDLLGKYQEYFLNKNKVWVTNYLSNLKLDQLHVYPFLLSTLKKYHKTFYKELITDDYFNAIASEISFTPATRFSSIQRFILVLGTDKEKLVKNLNWETLAKTANKAEVAQLTQVAVFINALGTDRAKLIEKLDWETLAKTANKAEMAQLRQVADFINALRIDKQKLSTFFNIDVIINYSNDVSNNQIGSFCTLVASIELEKQNELIPKIDWVSILNKITTYYKYQIQALTYVLHYQNEKCKILNQLIGQDDVRLYLRNNNDIIIRFAIQYFISPDDFQLIAKLLKEVFPYASELTNRIIERLKYKIVKDFNISPRYYLSFSILLDVIHKIRPEISNFIIINDLVRDKLYNSFEDNDLNRQIEGLQNLLETIKIINPGKYKEINEMERIVNLNLPD